MGDTPNPDSALVYPFLKGRVGTPEGGIPGQSKTGAGVAVARSGVGVRGAAQWGLGVSRGTGFTKLG